jgi:hypothetical protein
VRTLEEITYEAGRHALADQTVLVAGIRQTTSTLLAAHALVASFLGATAIRVHGLHGWAWVALATLVVALVIAAVLLAPWRLDFAIDAGNLYARLSQQAGIEADEAEHDLLVAAGFAYQGLRNRNAQKVRRMSALSALLGVLIVLQALAWIAGLIG